MPEDELDTEQALEEQPLEQPDSQDSNEEGLADISSLEDIDYDSLTPDMQKAYDKMSESWDNMNKGWTQKTQNLSQIRTKAEYYDTLLGDPEIARLIQEAVYRKNKGESLDGMMQNNTQPKEEIDPQNDPVGFMKQTIRDEVRGVLGEVLPDLRNEIQLVSGVVRTNQANAEFNNLASKYPAVKSFGLEELNRIRSQYKDASGNPISMEKAVGILALDNPGILTSNSTPAKKPTPKVEKPAQSNNAGAVLPPIPQGIAQLKARVQENEKAGISGLSAIKNRAYEKMRQLKR